MPDSSPFLKSTVENSESQESIWKFETKFLEIITRFDGNPSKSAAFLDTANTLIKTYGDSNPINVNCVQNVTLIYGIYSK